MLANKTRTRRPPLRSFFAAAILVMYWVLVPFINAKFGTSLPEWRGSATSQPAAVSVATGNSGAVEDSAASNDSLHELDGLQFGFLKSVGSDRFESPAGLIYGPGSQEGHRIKHVARHVNDIPTRPGPHGVFDGDLETALRVIDEAYEKAGTDSGAEARDDGERSVYTVPMGRRVGFVGGRDGKRDGNPDAERIRLVLEGNRLITAFPL